MKIFRNKNFSKKDPKPKLKQRTGVPELVSATILTLPSTLTGVQLGGTIAKDIVTDKIKKGVNNRLRELGERAIHGDVAAREAIYKMSKDPSFTIKLSNIIHNNPRLNKAVKKGMIIGASIPLAINGSLVASGIYKNKKHSIAKEQYLKDLKAWKERNNKK